MSDTRELPIRRRDEDSDWHDLAPVPCPTCGCTHYEAKDDPEIIWEPGRAWDEGCKYRSCDCHTDPVIGARRA
ncbi:MAG: hypothetical protein ACRDK3_07825 [Actinomycetota bacterium]